mgnify:CR=1 FL=1
MVSTTGWVIIAILIAAVIWGIYEIWIKEKNTTEETTKEEDKEKEE